MPKPKKKAATSKSAAPSKAKESSNAAAQLDIKSYLERFKEKAGDKKIVLHLGFNGMAESELQKNYPEENWAVLRMGEEDPKNTHIIGGLKDILKLPTECIDAVWCSHILQRLHAHEHILLLKALQRCIKFGGHFYCKVADMETIAGYIARGNLTEPVFDTAVGPISPMDILYGWRAALEKGHLALANHSAFTAVTLGLLLREAGFSNIRVLRDFYDLVSVSFKIPTDHPQFLEKVSINQGTDKRLKELPPVPALARTPHPGAKWQGKMSDELDVPPQIISTSDS